MSEGTLEGTGGVLVLERLYAHPAEKLWRALTEGELLAQWLMANDFEPRVGREFRFQSQAMPGWDGVIACEVLAVEAPRQLSYRWRALGLDSVVTFTLTAAEGGTMLRMEQRGFVAGQERAYGGAKYGWQQFLGRLDAVTGGVA